MAFKILVPVDGSEHSRAALRYLASRRKAMGEDALVELLNVQDAIPVGVARMLELKSLSGYYDKAGEEVFEQLEDEIDAFGETPVKKVTVGGAPKDAIVEEAEKLDADMIVMGSRGRGPMSSFFLGSVSNAVIGQSKRPLLLLREHTQPCEGAMRVAIALDGSEYGLRAAEYVLSHVEFFGKDATFTLVHVVSSYPHFLTSPNVEYVMPPVTDKEFKAEQHRRFTETVTPAVELFRDAGVPVETVCLEGVPFEEVARYTRQKADLLVMGSHGYGNFQSAVMGSNAMHIAAECDVPLLVIRR